MIDVRIEGDQQIVARLEQVSSGIRNALCPTECEAHVGRTVQISDRAL